MAFPEKPILVVNFISIFKTKVIGKSSLNKELKNYPPGELVSPSFRVLLGAADYFLMCQLNNLLP